MGSGFALEPMLAGLARRLHQAFDAAGDSVDIKRTSNFIGLHINCWSLAFGFCYRLDLKLVIVSFWSVWRGLRPWFLPIGHADPIQVGFGLGMMSFFAFDCSRFPAGVG